MNDCIKIEEKIEEKVEEKVEDRHHDLLEALGECNCGGDGDSCGCGGNGQDSNDPD
ncbi:MAG: hypothetical protein F6K41_00860 [Symploca sp. SIO3E6]|nr:hypothetical protein [Caldora sp. SIO3E6]